MNKEPKIWIFGKQDYEHYAKCQEPIEKCVRCQFIWGYRNDTLGIWNKEIK